MVEVQTDQKKRVLSRAGSRVLSARPTRSVPKKEGVASVAGSLTNYRYCSWLAAPAWTHSDFSRRQFLGFLAERNWD